MFERRKLNQKRAYYLFLTRAGVSFQNGVHTYYMQKVTMDGIYTNKGFVPMKKVIKMTPIPYSRWIVTGKSETMADFWEWIRLKTITGSVIKTGSYRYLVIIGEDAVLFDNKWHYLCKYEVCHRCYADNLCKGKILKVLPKKTVNELAERTQYLC